MPTIKVFLDSSAVIAGIISPVGAARALLQLAEDQKISVLVSEQVIAEVERNLARKLPHILPFARELILSANLQILRNPPPAEVERCTDWIRHPPDVSILVAASKAQVDFLSTLNKNNFILDPEVAIKSGLRIGTPGDCLGWVREHFS
jgi:putative PIN family toxin of toxin-antitoxin system